MMEQTQIRTNSSDIISNIGLQILLADKRSGILHQFNDVYKSFKVAHQRLKEEYVYQSETFGKIEDSLKRFEYLQTQLRCVPNLLLEGNREELEAQLKPHFSYFSVTAEQGCLPSAECCAECGKIVEIPYTVLHNCDHVFCNSCIKNEYKKRDAYQQITGFKCPQCGRPIGLTDWMQCDTNIEHNSEKDILLKKRQLILQERISLLNSLEADFSSRLYSSEVRPELNKKEMNELEEFDVNLWLEGQATIVKDFCRNLQHIDRYQRNSANLYTRNIYRNIPEFEDRVLQRNKDINLFYKKISKCVKESTAVKSHIAHIVHVPFQQNLTRKYQKVLEKVKNISELSWEIKRLYKVFKSE